MKLEPWWSRIAGMHQERNADLGCVWLAYDKNAGVAYLYDAAVFRMEVPAVIQYGISARGRHIPLVARKQDEALAERLLDDGINVVPEYCDDTQAERELWQQELVQRLEAQTLRVERRVGEFAKEYTQLQRVAKTDGATNRWEVPADGFPLMAATRYAIKSLEWAYAEYHAKAKQLNHPDIKVY